MRNGPLISGCLIVKDEEALIKECLTRLWKAVDEIVVVDTGSTDATVSLAHSLGARVIQHEWRDDFAEARNVSLAHAQYPWVLVVDADEYLDESSLGELDVLSSTDTDAFRIDVVNFPDDDDRRVISKHVALFRNDPRFRYEGAIHEVIATSILRTGGQIGYLPLRVEHHGYKAEVVAAKNKRERNRSIIVRELRRHPDDARLNYYLAQEYFVHGEMEEAVKYYRRALWRSTIEDVSMVPIAALRLMIALSNLSRWDEAYEVHEQYQVEYDDYTDLHFLRGVLSRRMGDYSRAEAELLKAISRGDASPQKYQLVHAGFGTYRAWTALAELYQELGREKDAFLAFSEALRANSRYAPAVRGLVRLSLRHDPPSAVLNYLMSIADLQNEACAEEAWQAFFSQRAWKECWALSRLLSDPHQRLKDALIAVRRGSMDEARSLLADLSQHSAFLERVVIVGVLVAVESDDTDWGRTLLSRLDATDHEVLYAVLADLLEVTSEWNAQLPRDPSTVAPAGTKSRLESAWGLLADAVRLGLANAVELLGRLIARYGEPVGQRALRFGRALWQEGLYEAAVEQYLRAGLDGVYDIESLLAVTKYGIESGQPGEVVAVLQKIIEMDPLRALPYVLLARTLRDLGQDDRARETLQEGLQRNPYATLLIKEMEMLPKGDRAS